MSNEPEDESLGVEQLPQDELEATPNQTHDRRSDEPVNPNVDAENPENFSSKSSSQTVNSQ